jgi:SAM-dependent methyltransferase
VAEWWQTFFDATYRDLWASQTSAERTAADVAGIEAVLAAHGAPRPARVLDLGCGDGRIAVPLAGAGHQVTGLDLSESMLAAAGQRAREHGVGVRFIRADMRDADAAGGPFDVVVSWFSSFGYFGDPAADAATLAAVARALSPGGVLLLETQHRDRIAATHAGQPAQRDWRESADVLLLAERWFDPIGGRAGEHLRLLHRDGRREDRELAVRLYSATELCALLADAGLAVEACYGGPGPTPFSLTSRLLAVARRSAT